MVNIADLEVLRKVNYREFTNKGKTYNLSDYPYMDIVLHDHCGHKCKFCIGHLVHSRERLPMSPSIFQKMDFAIDTMGVKEVLLLGGEPTTSGNLFEVISYLGTKNLNKICMTTNGRRVTSDVKFAEEVCSSGLTHLNVSLMSMDEAKQKYISGVDYYLGIDKLARLYDTCKKHSVCLRINTNVFLGNQDSPYSILSLYDKVRSYCDNIKFSSLLRSDSFSTVNEVTKFNDEHTLPGEAYDALFGDTEQYFSSYPLVVNNATLGFVKNTLVALPTPLIFNYNHSGKLRKLFVEERKVNGVKLLPIGELSYSWNREEKELFVDTNASSMEA